MMSLTHFNPLSAFNLNNHRLCIISCNLYAKCDLIDGQHEPKLCNCIVWFFLSTPPHRVQVLCNHLAIVWLLLYRCVSEKSQLLVECIFESGNGQSHANLNNFAQMHRMSRITNAFAIISRIEKQRVRVFHKHTQPLSNIFGRFCL